ncbi:hypothetical protein [Haloplasma contractile]|uniref:Thioldisulfide interchange protein DsbD n=1 Tax=Haloplasma contractile SSD-17B TaxID=1033810 RepID=F7PVE0_9MOLU|nr:hypothetical protein [Haloplasma contractile]ERJ12895.1 Thioldisulfide interchange protein DsbD [Haloplasma contractile SSD-17B]
MKKLSFVMMTMIILTLFVSSTSHIVQAEDNEETEKKVVYFYSPTCSGCQTVKPYVDSLPVKGITLIKYDITDHTQNNYKLLRSYNASYYVPEDEGTVPIIFVGDTYVSGVDDIIQSIETDGEQSIYELAKEDLKDIQVIDFDIEGLGFWGFLTIVFSGLLDGFNPCAIAMLLLFISLLGFTDKRKTLIAVSVTYISALYLTYFALGTILFRFIRQYQSQIMYLSTIITWIVIILALSLFVFSLYDFIVSKNEEYAKIKLQLPKTIQKFNKKLIKYFTRVFDEQSNISLIPILLLTFLLGFIISLTEFLCTGQIYLPIIIGLVQFGESTLLATLMLVIYNLMFVLPLIVIAVVSIKSKSVLLTSNWVRENLHRIKLFNAIFFLLIAIFFIVTNFIL